MQAIARIAENESVFTEGLGNLLILCYFYGYSQIPYRSFCRSGGEKFFLK